MARGAWHASRRALVAMLMTEALVVSAAVAVRMGTPTPARDRQALTVVAANEVRTELDLTDFEPVAQVLLPNH